MEHLRDKVAFITGGASGIGFGIARACLDAGMKVVIADVRNNALESAAASLAANPPHVDWARRTLRSTNPIGYAGSSVSFCCLGSPASPEPVRLYSLPRRIFMCALRSLWRFLLAILLVGGFAASNLQAQSFN